MDSGGGYGERGAGIGGREGGRRGERGEGSGEMLLLNDTVRWR